MKRSLQIFFQTEKTLIKDGAMGTEIMRRGTPTTLPLWSAACLLTKPQLVKAIHKDYIAAGAGIITTNTFRTTARSFQKVGLSEKEATAATLLACHLAKEARKESNKKNKVLIAGSVAPLEDCYSPDLTPSEKDLVREHDAYVANLKHGGVDFILAETMITIREAKAVAKAAKKYHIPFAVSFCCTAGGKLLSGESLEEAVHTIELYKPIFIGVNCMSTKDVTKVIKKLKKYAHAPLSAYGQGNGIPSDDQGWKFDDKKNSDMYVAEANKWYRSGATIFGGCCGTNPLYIKKLAKNFTVK